MRTREVFVSVCAGWRKFALRGMLWPLVVGEVAYLEVAFPVDFVSFDAAFLFELGLPFVDVFGGDVVVEGPDGAFDDFGVVDSAAFVVGVGPEHGEVEAAGDGELGDVFAGAEAGF